MILTHAHIDQNYFGEGDVTSETVRLRLRRLQNEKIEITSLLRVTRRWRC